MSFRCGTPGVLAVAVSVLYLIISRPADAAPPASCAKRFVGDWNHVAPMVVNQEKFLPDGSALCSGNAFCHRPGAASWTCEGNVLIFDNGMGRYNYTLQPDGNTIHGPNGIVVTRIGAAAADGARADGPAQRPAARPDPAQTPNARACANASEALEKARSVISFVGEYARNLDQCERVEQAYDEFTNSFAIHCPRLRREISAANKALFKLQCTNGRKEQMRHCEHSGCPSGTGGGVRG